MGAYRVPISHPFQPRRFGEFEEVGLGKVPPSRPDPKLTVPAPHAAGASPPANVIDIEAQRGVRKTKSVKFYELGRKISDAIKGRRVLASVGVIFILMLLWIIPYMLFRSNRQ